MPYYYSTRRRWSNATAWSAAQVVKQAHGEARGKVAILPMWV